MGATNDPRLGVKVGDKPAGFSYYTPEKLTCEACNKTNVVGGGVSFEWECYSCKKVQKKNA